MRAALLPEGAGDFDREFRQAMAETTETLVVVLSGGTPSMSHKSMTREGVPPDAVRRRCVHARA
ncbi:hypothetical protein [Phytoactinopolyspora halophila]|uniref:hypothetical protein n=1 Tax=Phytoactinopolyspora halophila TaxID=1981511 RepID=UPI003CCC85EB